MVYKTLIKFSEEKNYQLAKSWLKGVISDNEGVCTCDKDKDHYESKDNWTKIVLNHKTLEILADCWSGKEEFRLREALQERFGEKE